jgi:hypothetical protein
MLHPSRVSPPEPAGGANYYFSSRSMLAGATSIMAPDRRVGRERLLSGSFNQAVVDRLGRIADIGAVE